LEVTKLADKTGEFKDGNITINASYEKGNKKFTMAATCPPAGCDSSSSFAFDKFVLDFTSGEKTPITFSLNYLNKEKSVMKMFGDLDYKVNGDTIVTN